MEVYGHVANIKNLKKLDQVPLEAMQRGGPTPRIKRIFYNGLYEFRGQRQGI